MKQKLIPILALCALLSSCITDSTGKKTLDPAIRNAVIQVAQSAVAGLAAGAAKSGTVNWRDAAQGALTQVYSAQSTDAINKAIGYSGLPTAYQASISTAVTSVIAAAKDQGMNQKAAIIIGTTALDNALQASKSP